MTNYNYLMKYGKDQEILKVLSENKDYNNPVFFKYLLDRKNILLKDFKPDNESWRDFYFNMIYYISLLDEEFGIKYSSLQKYNPKEEYKFYKQREKEPKGTGLEDMPCDILLKIGENLSPSDIIRLSQVTKSIKICLDTGRLNPSETQKANDFLNKMRSEHDLYFIPSSYTPKYRDGKTFSIHKLYKSVENGLNTKEEFEEFVGKLWPDQVIVDDEDGDNLLGFVGMVEDELGSYEPLNSGQVVIVFSYKEKKVKPAFFYEFPNPDYFIIWSK